MRKSTLRRVLIGILALMIFSGLVLPSLRAQGVESPDFKADVSVRYRSHAPIRINNDTELEEMAQSEGWYGSGTQYDPYEMRWYEIDAQGAGSGIYIGNTTKYLDILYVKVYNASYHSVPYEPGAGITLYNTQRVAIKSSYISNNSYGVYIREMGWNYIVGDEIKNNSQYGVYLAHTRDIHIFSSNISYNKGGVGMYDCYACIVRSSELYSNGANSGISLYSSTVNTIIDQNKIMYTSGYGDGIRISGGSATTMGANGNTISYNEIYNNSGRGIYILYANGTNINNNSIHNNSDHGIYLYSEVYNTTIELNDIYGNAKNGVELSPYTTYNIMYTTIRYNNISYNYVGIDMGRNTYYSNIYNNSFYRNTGYGVSIYTYCYYNRVYNNSFIYNNGATDTYYSSHVQASDSGANNYWNTSGTPHGYGNYWSDWSSPDSNGDGIVDNPYEIDGTAGSEDNYPLATEPLIPELSFGWIIIVLVMGIIFVLRRK